MTLRFCERRKERRKERKGDNGEWRREVEKEEKKKKEEKKGKKRVTIDGKEKKGNMADRNRANLKKLWQGCLERLGGSSELNKGENFSCKKYKKWCASDGNRNAPVVFWECFCDNCLW